MAAIGPYTGAYDSFIRPSTLRWKLNSSPSIETIHVSLLGSSIATPSGLV